jgi:hypothetical protein
VGASTLTYVLKGFKMLTNLELYGTEDVPPVPKEVANERIILLKENLIKQLKLPTEEQSSHTQTKIVEGIKFWRKLSDQEDVGI